MNKRQVNKETDVSRAVTGSAGVKRTAVCFYPAFTPYGRTDGLLFHFLDCLQSHCFCQSVFSGGATWFPKRREEMEVWKCGRFCFERIGNKKPPYKLWWSGCVLNPDFFVSYLCEIRL